MFGGGGGDAAAQPREREENQSNPVMPHRGLES
jgi:hypothetical protein